MNIVPPEYHLLRASIEAAVKSPAVILVTSACARDGKSVTSFGLAQSLAEAGHRVAVIDAKSGGGLTRPTVLRGLPSIIAQVRMPLEASDPRASRNAISAFTRDLRREFDFAIIDGATFMASSAGMLLAAAADGVLLSVRVGRRQTEDDALMIRTLAQSNTRLLGAVAVSSDRIVQFASEGVADITPDRVPAFEPQSGDEITSATASLAR